MTSATANSQAHLTLILGGVRSGKSARALRVAQSGHEAGRVLFVATAEPFDDEMRKRISTHRAERPAFWTTIEAPLDLPEAIGGALAKKEDPYAVVIVDCLTLWVSNVLCSMTDGDDAEDLLARRTNELLQVRATVSHSRQRWIIVSNEVGLGVVPPTPLGRRYRDALGRVNQIVAAAADQVTLMVAGMELPVK